MTVGGVPNIVAIVRDTWMPDWYLLGCVAASHYDEAEATIEWVSDSELVLNHSGTDERWTSLAPFHDEGCDDITISLTPMDAES